MTSTDSPRFQIHPDAAWQEAAGEVFVVTGDNRLHNLRDEVAVALWSRLEGEGATLRDLVLAIEEDFEVNEAIARADIDAFLADAESRSLVTRID